MKKALILMLCAAMLLTTAACSIAYPQGAPDTIGGIINELLRVGAIPAIESPVPETPVITDEPASIANPFVDCISIEECSSIAGFTLTVPDTIQDSHSRLFRAIDNNLIEIIYLEASGEELCRIRKSPGAGDISGDYRAYTAGGQFFIEETPITYRGEAEKVRVATWQIDEYAFSFTAENDMDAAAVADIIKNIA